MPGLGLQLAQEEEPQLLQRQEQHITLSQLQLVKLLIGILTPVCLFFWWIGGKVQKIEDYMLATNARLDRIEVIRTQTAVADATACRPAYQFFSQQ